MARVALILGGARSGKSARALALTRPPRVFLATAQALDEEMAARIAAHRAERGPDWTVVEEPLELTRALAAHAAEGRCVLVDCLTLWLSNLMAAGRDPEAEAAALAAALPALPGEIVFVSNEVGMGLAPMNALGRAFRDAQGRLNQTIAAVADRVEFVAAGLPLTLKDRP
ncbi:bifunctional adenosylcobinamide kinase/adenosylcobinamide-phosphate guanylyltransferase [Oceanicella actignis]|uniref:Bifunctional adenosylcobalamin biosynthesis protein n=1 Tax=Oceanicella actignis TaxID=1189325 RepID=A0A1M7THJ4_9RHOB|nr:bifunctional adenosylcobinamide kinase/adenosylcobinamide-phosphate guanylyltransferase [Oceanicella actignis]TYO88448.1 adenosylcobinamide kinase /adenosylcobinamide-phosphate guanylyltransferase [Oceanicella actignis]SET58711.1 adenosylcobinamide kinase /adenosylcobinamide-phosphate guanylyltransferase [Oceanicella actignis]SHN70222.1 adenosylcobinamide kinase /adenosylcobinamide-phosphate guanylyltransferase [Oceanicella actignis]